MSQPEEVTAIRIRLSSIRREMQIISHALQTARNDLEFYQEMFE